MDQRDYRGAGAVYALCAGAADDDGDFLRSDVLGDFPNFFPEYLPEIPGKPAIFDVLEKGKGPPASVLPLSSLSPVCPGTPGKG